MVRLLEGLRDGIGIGDELPDVGDVRPERGVHEICVRTSRLEVDDRRQRVVVDDDGTRGVDRLVGRPGDDDGDGIPDVGDLLDRERQVKRCLHVGGDRPRTGQSARPGVTEIGAGIGGDDARAGERVLRGPPTGSPHGRTGCARG